MQTASTLKKWRLSYPGKPTQKEVAIGVGLTQGNYSKKESGEVATTLEDLEKLSKFYGVPTWQILKCNVGLVVAESDNGKAKNDEEVKDMITRILELTDVVSTMNRMLKQRDSEIEKLKREIEDLKRDGL